MDTQRNARLVLKSSDLTINASSVYGTCDTYRSTMTWNNINLRMLLGDMYDEYDLFNLALNTISTGITPSTSTSAGSTVNDRNCYVKISGLPFVNQTYLTKNNSNSVYTYIATFNYAPDTTVSTSTQYFYSNNIATFGKNQDICNITISMSRLIDDTIPLTGTLSPFPQIAFIFNILGITREKGIQNATRILKN